jgi:two-component system sensor histidine kinase BaeS
MRLSTRLGFSYLAVILIGMGSVIPLAWLAVEHLYLNNQIANLLAQAELTAAALKSNELPLTTSSPYSQLQNALPGIHTRVIDAQSAVVIDLVAPDEIQPSSVLDLPSLAQNSAGAVTQAELLSRPEITQALSGHAIAFVRNVDSAGGKPVLYAAAPVISSNGMVTQIVYLAMPLPDTRWTALPASVRWQLIGAVLVAIILASLAGLLFARTISNPINRLVRAAHAVAGGNLDQKVPGETGGFELATLSQAFNTMTTSLRRADQAKNTFIAAVSHELRTPLTVIKGTIETLQDGAMDDISAREQFLSSMGEETERLIHMVNDLLVLTRADGGALDLQLQPVELVELARSRCNKMEQIARKRQVSLVVIPPVGPNGGRDMVYVLADPDRIAQVVDNLLDNAVRYSPIDREVKVIISGDNELVSCKVVDSGPGIPAQNLPFIFDRFYRVDPARDREHGGSGLGLSIVRSLVEAHGGHVVANSVEGEGATFTFWLPAEKF